MVIIVIILTLMSAPILVNVLMISRSWFLLVLLGGCPSLISAINHFPFVIGSFTGVLEALVLPAHADQGYQHKNYWIFFPILCHGRRFMACRRSAYSGLGSRKT